MGNVFQLLPALHHVACDELAKHSRSETTERVEEEVPPIGRTGRGERLLPYLDESAEKDRRYDSPWDEARCLGGLTYPFRFDIYFFQFVKLKYNKCVVNVVFFAVIKRNLHTDIFTYMRS